MKQSYSFSHQDVACSSGASSPKAAWYNKHIRKVARWVLKAELAHMDACYKYQTDLGMAHLKIIDGFQYGQDKSHDVIESLYSLAYQLMSPEQRKYLELSLGLPNLTDSGLENLNPYDPNLENLNPYDPKKG